MPPRLPWTPSTEQQLLDLMRAPADRWSRVFILGSLERRVTLASQQSRALNLIHSLATQPAWTTQRPRIAVIGAGVAGVMAAVAAADKGASVTILDREHEALSTQRDCHSR